LQKKKTNKQKQKQNKNKKEKRKKERKKERNSVFGNMIRAATQSGRVTRSECYCHNYRKRPAAQDVVALIVKGKC